MGPERRGQSGEVAENELNFVLNPIDPCIVLCQPVTARRAEGVQGTERAEEAEEGQENQLSTASAQFYMSLSATDKTHRGIRTDPAS